jgi:hypothetical protein
LTAGGQNFDHGSIAGCFVGDVGHDAKMGGGAGAAFQLSRRGFGVGVCQIKHHHARAVGGHHARRGKAQSVQTRAASNDGHFACKQH